MLQIISSIIDKSYYRLIDYALMRCDVFTFHVPNYNKICVTEKNKECYPEYDVGYVKTDESNDDFIIYKNNVASKIEPLQKSFIHNYYDVEYMGSIFGYESEITLVDFNEEAYGFLKATGDLYNWKYPHMPEDLCFFSKGQCWLRSIAHEKLCFIYTDDDLEIQVIKKIGLKFIEMPSEAIPALRYTLKY